MVESVFEIQLADIGHHDPRLVETAPAMRIEKSVELRSRQRRLAEDQRPSIGTKPLCGGFHTPFDIAMVRRIQRVDGLQAL